MAFDVSPAVRNLAAGCKTFDFPTLTQYWKCGKSEDRRSRGPPGRALQLRDAALQVFSPAATIPDPLANFEGLSNQDNFNIFGFRVNPPDPTAKSARTTTSRW